MQKFYIREIRMAAQTFTGHFLCSNLSVAKILVLIQIGLLRLCWPPSYIRILIKETQVMVSYLRRVAAPIRSRLILTALLTGLAVSSGGRYSLTE